MVSFSATVSTLSDTKGLDERDLPLRKLSKVIPRMFAAEGITSQSSSHHRLQGLRVEKESTDRSLAPDRLEALQASELAIRQQLDRMLQSRVFVQSERLSRFLRFVVEHAICGTGSCLKEYVIGSEVYDRKPPYQPSQDSIVRTEARRLRGKIKEYYEAEGKDDPVYVYLRPGSYVPVFHCKESRAGFRSQTNAKAPCSLAGSSPILIAILPFLDISRNQMSSTYARGIPDELAFALMQTGDCRVVSTLSLAQLATQEHDVPAMMDKIGAQIAFEGSVRAEGNHIRVTARILDAAGVQLWVNRVDTEAGLHAVFATEEKIASTLFAGFDALFDRSQRRRAM